MQEAAFYHIVLRQAKGRSDPEHVFWIGHVKQRINKLQLLGDAVAIIQLRLRHRDFKVTSFANLFCGFGISLCFLDGSVCEDLSQGRLCVDQSSVQEFTNLKHFSL